MAKKRVLTRGQQRNLRTYQIVMGIIGILVVLSMVLSLIVR